MPSTPKSNRESSSPATTTTTTPNKSAIKQLPDKLAKKVKRQFGRVLHHVIHPKRRRTPTYSITSPKSPLFYPVGVVRAFLPPNQSSASGSVDSRDIWDVKDGKEADLHSINSLANHSIDFDTDSDSSTSTTHIDMSDELHFPQEESQSNPHEQDPSASVISPTTFIEPETPDPFLVDDEDDGDSPSEEESEENTSSDANSQQVVSPSETVPLDLPSSPVASTPRPHPLIPNLQKDVPPPPSEYEEEEYIPEIYVPALIVPTMFLPIPNVRCSFSSDVLTWWLSRNLMYNNCTRQIL